VVVSGSVVGVVAVVVVGGGVVAVVFVVVVFVSVVEVCQRRGCVKSSWW